MTTNQIQWHALGETTRHNQATESETHRNNLATETELNRSHLAAETETHRHNVRTERLDKRALHETVRSNKARERESKRSNRAREKEARRSNQAQESIQTQSNLANQGLTARKIALDYASKQRELAETARHNRSTEGFTGIQTQIRAGELKNATEMLAETVRTHKANESITRANNRFNNAVKAATALVSAIQKSREIDISDKKTNAEISKLEKQVADLELSVEKAKKDNKLYAVNWVFDKLDTLSGTLKSVAPLFALK